MFQHSRMRAKMRPSTSQVRHTLKIAQTLTENSDDRVTNSTPMKLSRSPPPSPMERSGVGKTESFLWDKVWRQIRAAEEAANIRAANINKTPQKKSETSPAEPQQADGGSEIMISSSEDDAVLDASYMKWLKPETAKAIKQRILNDIKALNTARMPAAKNLNLE